GAREPGTEVSVDDRATGARFRPGDRRDPCGRRWRPQPSPLPDGGGRLRAPGGGRTCRGDGGRQSTGSSDGAGSVGLARGRARAGATISADRQIRTRVWRGLAGRLAALSHHPALRRCEEVGMTEGELREAIVRFARQMTTTGLVRGTSGNLSARQPGASTCLVTPSGVDYEAMKPEDVVLVDLSGRSVAGGPKPSV